MLRISKRKTHAVLKWHVKVVLFHNTEQINPWVGVRGLSTGTLLFKFALLLAGDISLLKERELKIRRPAISENCLYLYNKNYILFFYSPNLLRARASGIRVLAACTIAEVP